MSSTLSVPQWRVPQAPTTGGVFPEAAQLAVTIFSSALTNWIRLPAAMPQPLPKPQLQARELLDWSGLSHRVLAEILGITHPTLRALVDGTDGALSKKPEVLVKLDALHSLATRLAPFEIAEGGSMKRALLSPLGDKRIADIAAAGALSDAYIAALKVVAPREPRRLRQATTRKRAGTATVALEG